MPLAALFAADILAVGILTFGLYFPRHRRRDMIVALLGINVGVLGVTQALASADVNAGLGLGLFGVLSIIRLRSAEMDQSEVAYYFAALTVGLLGGLSVTPGWVSPVLMVAILAAIYVGDHPSLLRSYRSTVLTLDRAFTDERELRHHLEGLLGGAVHLMNVRKVDLVHDITVVDVRYRIDDVNAVSPSYTSVEFEVDR
jgi:hypothetical protein